MFLYTKNVKLVGSTEALPLSNEGHSSYSLDSISRIIVNNIYANLGGDSSSEEDITAVSDMDGVEMMPRWW